MKRRYITTGAIVLMLAILPKVWAQPIVAHGYEFTYGIDNSKWVVAPTNTTMYLGSTNNWTVQLPFDFTFYNRTYSSITIARNGTMFFGSLSTFDCVQYPYPPFPYNRDVAGIWGLGITSLDNIWGLTPTMQSWCQMPDSVGRRIFVFQCSTNVYGREHLWQIQLHEEDNSVTMAYREGAGPASNSPQGTVGLQFENNVFIAVSPGWTPVYNTIWTVLQNNIYYIGWPGPDRYYHIVPIDTVCPPPAVVGVESSWQIPGRVRLLWHSCDRHSSYTVEYGPAGFSLGTGTVITTADTSLTLTGLTTGQDYEAHITATCTDSQSSPPAYMEFRPPCSPSSENQIAFFDLLANNVTCYTGTTSYPSNNIMIVDSGSVSPLSRHTVHTNPLERDPRTGNQLYTIPSGHCASVRLGNWRNGAEQEAIAYTLHIDTNNYDLMVLRYALVDEDPSHVAANQPQFEFNITDSRGNSIGNCYHGLFVSGDLSDWQQGEYNVLWRDWDAVGVDLAPLHGQTIRVTLSNRDCAQTGHFGYGYFTLESSHKTFHSTSCSETSENTFHAPEGFTYRWYNAANPAVTLSTTDSLHVTDTGIFCCRANYQLSGQVCGFTMSTYMGSRYPVAAFEREEADSCGTLIRFSNHSVIARDSAHTQLTSFPCEQYLWVFDDGTTSSDPNPVHLYYADGPHTVTLYAMLADGACVDSVSDTFYLDLPRDTVYDSICSGRPYMFHGERIYQAGQHSYIDSCEGHVLFLHHFPKYDQHIYDTLTIGETYTFDGNDFTAPAIYRKWHSSIHGCDSMVTLYLSSREERYLSVCADMLPFTCEGLTFSSAGCDTAHLIPRSGTDSIIIVHLSVREHPAYTPEVEAYCNDSAGYTLTLSDTLCHTILASPPDPMLPQNPILGGEYNGVIHLRPSDTTQYHVIIDYCDAPTCPSEVYYNLQPITMVEARMSVEPEFLTENVRDFTAIDLSDSASERQWFVNSVPEDNSDAVLHYHVAGDMDSVRVMLVVGNEYCTDTATTTVSVRIQSLWFPNIFTPDEPTNNVFRGYGINVKDYDLKIFTRWGDCFFHTTDPNEGWDGTYHGIKSPVSAYVYLCHYTTPDGEPRTVCGTVTLLR